jgi:hypothetical protein
VAVGTTVTVLASDALYQAFWLLAKIWLLP